MHIVMISTIMLVVTLMVEIAVDLMSIHSIAQNVYALNNEGQYITTSFEKYWIHLFSLALYITIKFNQIVRYRTVAILEPDTLCAY